MSGKRTIATIEAHAAGEPLRVIVDGIDPIPGVTILDKRRYAREHLDGIRKSLMWEPRGHADMYGAIITEPVTQDGDFGVLFLHNEGFSTMCGHGIIALTKVVLDADLIQKAGDSVTLNIDSPAGRIVALAHREHGEVVSVSFINVPSFVHTKSAKIDVPGYGIVPVVIAFGGAFYAFCDSSYLKITPASAHFSRIVETGRLIKTATARKIPIAHPVEADLGFLYGTILTGPAEIPAHHSRNVCIFANGEVDRSPTGTGVSARAAIHYDLGELEIGESITIESIIGTTFSVRIIKTLKYHGYDAVIPEVTGSAHITGESKIYLDPRDPLSAGFLLR